MPKFLLEATYAPDGVRGLMRDRATGREASIRQMLATMGGKLDALYFALGETDVYVICDLPDMATCAGLSMAVAASGAVRLKTTPLLTPAETDAAMAKGVIYRPPGS